jgi:DNA-binding transcriptional regulator LsrR (DeoR family)
MATTLTIPPTIPIVQLTGAVTEANPDDHSTAFLHNHARRSRAPAFLYDTPLVARTPATARAVRQRPDVARAFKAFPGITKAAVGIRLWQDGFSTLHDALAARDRDEMRRRGTIADLSGTLLTADGQPITGGITNRMIRIIADRLQAIPDVIGLAYQTEKAPAVRAAIRSKLVNNLVLDARLAEALLGVA